MAVFKWDEKTSVHEAIGNAMGYASLCWNPKPEGVFDSVLAADVATELEAFVEHHYLRKTKEMFDEVLAEADKDNDRKERLREERYRNAK